MSYYLITYSLEGYTVEERVEFPLVSQINNIDRMSLHYTFYVAAAVIRGDFISPLDFLELRPSVFGGF